MTKMELVDIADIAERLEVTKNTVYQWGRRRDSSGFPLPTIRKAGFPLWDWKVIEKWAKETGRIWVEPEGTIWD